LAAPAARQSNPDVCLAITGPFPVVVPRLPWRRRWFRLVRHREPLIFCVA
jgi:hypothetical protein